MAFYNIRDLLGHWVKPRSRQDKMCPHACCRGRRVHPANFPLILPRELLRKAPERDLLQHMADHGGNEKVARQLAAEIDRRDQAQKLRAARRRGAEHRRFARRVERQELVENAIARAEKATSGELVNAAGKRRGVTAESLFTGKESRALRYATPELLEYWETHPRPSAGYLSGNPRAIRNARARSDVGRVDYTTYRHLY